MNSRIAWFTCIDKNNDALSCGDETLSASLAFFSMMVSMVYPNCVKGALMPEGANSMTDDYRVI